VLDVNDILQLDNMLGEAILGFKFMETIWRPPHTLLGDHLPILKNHTPHLQSKSPAFKKSDLDSPAFTPLYKYMQPTQQANTSPSNKYQ